MTTERKIAEERKTGPANYIFWGAGDIVGAGIPAVTSGWLIYFYTTFCHMSAIDSGWLLGIPRFFDAITCPLIGYISDNLRHTWVGRHIGRRKIFLLIAIPLLPSFALMWVAGQTFLYYLFSYIFFELVYNCVLIPWETLPAEMTKDYNKKAWFAGIRIFLAQAFATVAAYLPTIIINHLGKDSATTFLINGAIFGAASSVLILLAVIFTWERPYSDGEKLIRPEPLDLGRAAMIPVRMFADLFSTLRLRGFRQHLSIYLGGYISQDIFNTAFPLFVTTVMMGAAATLVISQLMTVMYLAQIVSVAIAILVVLRAGPTRAYSLAIVSVITACALYYAFSVIRPAGFAAAVQPIAHNIFAGLAGGVSPVLLFWLFVPVILAGLGRGTLNLVPWSVYNYMPDIDEAVTGQRREGIFAGVMTLVRKLSQFIAIIGATTAMQLGGFRAGAPVQTPGAIHVIVLIVCAGPVIVMLLGFLVALNFRLNAKTHAVLMDEIGRLREGATEPATSESGAVVENLTGWKYETLWGRGK